MSPRYHDSEDSDIGSQVSALEISETQRSPAWCRRGPLRFCGSFSIRPSSLSPERRERRKALYRQLLIAFGILFTLGLIAIIIYLSIVAALLHHLSPPEIKSGLQNIVDNWQEPDTNGAYKYRWRDDFSRDIVPKHCHSHNDYWRRVPLYQALANGCIGVEADVWLTEDQELLVSHAWRATKKERTLRSLYLDPLSYIFEDRNVSQASAGDREVGLFDADPNASVILLIDFKNDGHQIWPVVLSQLQSFRDRNWLTYFNGTQLIKGPLTIVGTGNTPFELVQANNTNRFIFFDAPLDVIDDVKYTSENSYYASVNMKQALGRFRLHKIKPSQVEVIQKQVKAASDKGLVSRYWDTPKWPISFRDKVWFTLTENDVGMLNVDDIISATRWNWNMCIVAGIRLCGNS
ncbi:PLC-like phosphodiesterase [Lophiotrema nucula]|uniref:Altered inheritance of mitochondria protein 6 n=1 Tax=Lophiotrema nucula TaxID=690887 RepID=A0A6A5YWX4_9PLEO|nr:PLC-like phosphodiesterase [Lophiotrema nucula]